MPILIILFKGVIGDIVSPVTLTNNNTNNITTPTNQIPTQLSNGPNPSYNNFYSAFRKDSFLNSSFHFNGQSTNKNHSQLVSTYIISDTD